MEDVSKSDYGGTREYLARVDEELRAILNDIEIDPSSLHMVRPMDLSGEFPSNAAG